MDKSAQVNEGSSSAEQPFRILVVLNAPWDERLGVVRVWAELCRQWADAGHIAEHYSLTEAFPNTQRSGAALAMQQLLFTYKARAFVRQNAGRFDVVDALIGNLPWSKEALGFRGLLVARSVGLYRLYDRFEKVAAARWPSHGRLPSRIFYSAVRFLSLRASRASVYNADLINVPNEEEALCVRSEIRPDAPITVQPYGLSADSRQDFASAAAPATVRLVSKKICFVGMWSPRKGAHDWARIIALVRAEVKNARFVFLGTMVAPEKILKDVNLAPADWLELRSDYTSGELPQLLSDCTVGAFPSYVEGFGIAVLEQLAAGVPTIAYDVPGPRDMMMKDLPEFLVAVGDVEQFSAALVRVLQCDASRYELLSARSRKAAERFDWSTIAHETVQSYRTCQTKGALNTHG